MIVGGKTLSRIDNKQVIASTLPAAAIKCPIILLMLETGVLKAADPNEVLIAAAAQATLACVVSFWLLGLDTAGSPAWVFAIAIINAVLGVGLGLLCSAFARTEFQAVQFMPVVIAPQLLLCGIIVPREVLPDWLQWISNALPASYALEALQQVGAHADLTSTALRDIAIVIAFAVVALCLAAATLRRRTP